MKKTLLFFALALMTTGAISQLKTSDAYISFYSKMDDVTAKNTTVSSKLNTETGAISFEVKISAFAFANKTMQKHFNQEGVMNSVEFPLASFEGTIANNDEVDYTADGTYEVRVTGKMNIKGVTKKFAAGGKIIVKGGKISAVAAFELDRFEYGVTGKEKSISQILAIKVEANY